MCKVYRKEAMNNIQRMKQRDRIICLALNWSDVIVDVTFDLIVCQKNNCHILKSFNSWSQCSKKGQEILIISCEFFHIGLKGTS